MKKRVLSFALVLVMCLALLPSAALAAEETTIKEVYRDGNDTIDVHFTIENGVLKSCWLSKYGGVEAKGDIHLIIPDSVTSIGDNAFASIGDVTSITIPNSVKSIGNGAFAVSSGLKSITISDSVTSIGNGAFVNCESLTSITIPGSVTYLGVGVFSGCHALENVIIGNGVKSISDSMFQNCTNLTNISIPDSVTSIGNSTFAGCSSLKSITIPDSVKSIDNHAFQNCNNLKSITIPNSVTSFGMEVFPHGCEIKGASGSAVEAYVEANSSRNYIFVSTDGTTNPTKPALDLTSANTWAQEGITNAVAANLVPQNLQGAYTQATTRAEFAALAVALYEQVTGTTITERKTFDDTSDINVEKAAAIGIVAGVGDNRFDPNAGLTREQAAVMLARLADAIGKPLAKQAATFADNGNIATWANEQVGQIQAAGIMSGVGNNTFDPQGAYTREQSIVTILRLYDVVK